jgi:L-lactate dehydrogenase
MAIKRNKVVVVGAGAVGSAVAFNLVVQGICDDLVLIDINRDKAWAEATDLQHSLAYSNRNMNVRDGDYAACGDADIVVIAAALPFVKGQTRLDLTEKAAGIMRSIIGPVMQSGFQGIFIVITNPVDVMAYYAHKLSGLPARRVIGTGTALDSARLKYYIADVMKVDPRSVQALCLGEHGDSQVIPWSLVTVGGKNFLDILEDNRDRLQGIAIDQIAHNTSYISYKVMNAKGATTFGIAATTVEIIKAVLNDENKVIPVSTMLQGEYGENGVYVGVPAVLNGDGVKELMECRLSQREMAEFKQSVALIKEYQAKLGEPEDFGNAVHDPSVPTRNAG